MVSLCTGNEKVYEKTGPAHKMTCGLKMKTTGEHFHESASVYGSCFCIYIEEGATPARVYLRTLHITGYKKAHVLVPSMEISIYGCCHCPTVTTLCPWSTVSRSLLTVLGDTDNSNIRLDKSVRRPSSKCILKVI
ncbi:hypothetical protein XELAEV_18003215mg [Xenopus laevis]|nr:hypothetical protein XELAEV_18003215mg [Xenopus laevis]